MKNTILSTLTIALVSVLFLGFAFTYPSNLSQSVNPDGSFYVTPSQSSYFFSFSSSVQSDVIHLRVTPTNGDPELKEYCFDAKNCSLDLSNYSFDTSSDYIIYAGAGNGGYFIFEEN
ncbi:MAG: hypothetical protein JXR11_13500 [Balneola sp.]